MPLKWFGEFVMNWYLNLQGSQMPRLLPFTGRRPKLFKTQKENMNRADIKKVDV
ncbi:MAG: hypothetical protein FJ088_01775 [Deltaproteobacteria bacterium]|nr:hypothetical protein [Deltaproteobacteria bacterium]